MTGARRTDGYSRISIATHWFAALLVIALFFTHEGERGSTERMLHVSGGAIAGLFLLWRVWHRLYSGMTEKPDQAALLNLASRIVIWGFLVAIVVVVISGYLLPWSLGRPLDFFGLASIPSPMGASRGLHEFMEELHEISGHLFPPLIALHILGAAKHAFIGRDGIVKRMFKPVVGCK
ncbi:cytochrome b [Pelagibius sp. Alg239-R121]|uniref:cytochrome b n=1 Tax=Pelagibius sp. Alg239-R121 TaxID=2993448 RepID=UPI0024A6F8BE|nr:cytochrome b/b6 domain-containing protein [Pelagibius sp. Alg239-R121]